MWPWQRRTDEDFRSEIEAHIALETDRLIAEGVEPHEARRIARRTFGNFTSAQERFYESRRIRWVDELRQDIRYAARLLRGSPGFAAVALLTLSVGIGANTAIFSVVDAVLLRPLPYRDPASLVSVEPGDVGLNPPWAVTAWRGEARSLPALATFNGPRPVTLIDRDVREVIRATDISWDFLSLLGAPPALGRDFVRADAEPAAPAVAILSDALWRRLFAADPAVVGRTVTLGGTPVTVVGVTAAAFRFPTAGVLPSFGLPQGSQPDVLRVERGQRSVNVIGRLRRGTTAASASQELLRIYRQAGASEFSKSLLDRTQIAIVPLQERLVGSLSRRLWLVMGAVTFVLLVACANVANLLLARTSTRRRELAVRAALGARRGRLMRLLLTESLLLALIGSAGALLFAYSSGSVARTLLADRIPHVASIGIHWTVLAYNIGIATATGIACGLASLPGAAGLAPLAVLSGGDTLTVTGRSLTRRLLVAVQVAVSFVLVVGAALFARTLWNLSTQDNGFDADRLLTVRVAANLPRDVARSARLPGTDFRAQSAYFARFFTDLSERLGRLRGVTSAGAVSLGPLEGTSSGLCCVMVAGQPAPGGETLTPVGFVTPGYFRTMRIALVAGRDFTGDDRLGADRVAIVNEAFQRQFIPSGTAVGARITDVRATGEQDFTIVGVVRDVPDRSLRESPEPHILLPLAQMPAGFITWQALTFVLRVAGDDPLRLAPEVRREIWAIDPNIVITDVATMHDRLEVGMRAERDSALLFGLFGLAALVMAAIGVYGVAAYAVAQRTKEIGIRVALGAARSDIRRLVVAQTLWPTIVGVSIGIGAAAILTRLVAGMVYGVTPLDPATFAAAVVVLVSVAVAATVTPARRGARIDPLVALRYE